MAMSDRWRMSEGLRRTSAVVAVAALVIGGAKVASDHTTPGTGFSTVQTAAADPTGPGGPTGGPGMDGGQQFQPPQMPSSMPDYQGGNNQPPLDQNSGISIYNSGNPQAPQQVPGQQAGQQPQQAQQPAHGTQIPDYQNATQYTQGPGKPNPDYQAPQQNSPQQPQQGQQPQQQQPSQVPTQTQQPQNKQDDTTQQLNQRQQQCQAAAAKMGTVMVPPIGGGGGRSPIWWLEPGLDPVPTPNPSCPQCPPDTSQKPNPLDQLTPEQQQAIRDWAKEHPEEKACNKADLAKGLLKTVSGMGGAVFSGLSLIFTGGMDAPAAIITGSASIALMFDGVDQLKNSGCGDKG